MKKFIKYAPLIIAAISMSACGSGVSASSSGTPTTGWTWVGGSNESNAYGIYGSIGIAASANIPGGRNLAVSWIDNTGNFWLFGGSGNALSGDSGNLNDLWEYNPNSNQWTWVSGSNTVNATGVYGVQGIANAANTPGARIGAVSFRDTDGNLWLFGGFGNAETLVPGALNDLWKYNPSSNQWTWVSGNRTTDESGVYGLKGTAADTNVPGARLGAISWVDKAGNFWLFGGEAALLPGNFYNDLWEYSPSSNQWAWISGESTMNQPGIYGIQGTSTVATEPGARLDAVSFIDKDGNLWLFGGHGVDGAGLPGNLNDLWEYKQTTGQWTWMSGSNFSNQYGVYGVLAIGTPNTIPGVREHRVPLAFADTPTSFWMFGGDGNGASTTGYLNDLWQYNPGNNQWTWSSGDVESNAFGVYGNVGILSGNNLPGARKDSVGWVDSSGNLWIFGGDGNGTTTSGYLNDLWKYTTNTLNP